ncbi:MAG TPA: hypothetical protein DCW74_00160 [Alteromonas australica]|uniref:Uncharacterized protein n=1 Tax=Alteromonas australica TaxID=589873 RepID=A0A350NYL3_9ALTE|nr:hypothetical protein [Alteromonas australica]|tara:strand:- start:350 stop:727 length:378 start_codon:yes stop_codon:yes gene_type:complete
MAYSDTINLVVGDTLPEVTVTLKDSNKAATGKTLDVEDPTTWDPIDLTGATVRMRIRAVGSSTVLSTLTMAVQSPATEGKASTNFPDGTLASSGVFEAEVEITFSGGGKQTVHDLLKLKIRDDFD